VKKADHGVKNVKRIQKNVKNTLEDIIEEDIITEDTEDIDIIKEEVS